MRDRNLPFILVKQLAGHETRFFASRDTWMAHLETLGFAELKTHPDPVRFASVGALWGRIAAIGLLEGTIIGSDGAGQFRVGDHALCWIHGERLVYILGTFSEHRRKARERIRHRIWWLYADTKDYCHDPTPKRKEEFLAALERPDIPLHTNGSENDIR